MKKEIKNNGHIKSRRNYIATEIKKLREKGFPKRSIERMMFEEYQILKLEENSISK